MLRSTSHTWSHYLYRSVHEWKHLLQFELYTHLPPSRCVYVKDLLRWKFRYEFIPVVLVSLIEISSNYTFDGGVHSRSIHEIKYSKQLVFTVYDSTLYRNWFISKYKNLLPTYPSYGRLLVFQIRRNIYFSKVWKYVTEICQNYVRL